MANEWLKKLKETDPMKARKLKNKWQRDYKRRMTKEQRKIQNSRYMDKIRRKEKFETFMHYSNGVIQCNCCGELEMVFLTLDHIRGRKTYGHGYSEGGYKLYHKLVKENFPEGYQVLCFNCNWAKHRLGLCPHQEKKSLRVQQ